MAPDSAGIATGAAFGPGPVIFSAKTINFIENCGKGDYHRHTMENHYRFSFFEKGGASAKLLRPFPIKKASITEAHLI